MKIAKARAAYGSKSSARRLAEGFVSSLGGLGAFAAPPKRIEYPHASATGALRRDLATVGGDMKRVVARGVSGKKGA